MGAIGASVTGYSQKRPANKSEPDKTVYYTLERNDPANSGLFGVGLAPAIVDINELNINVSGGLELFYTYQSKFRANASYRYSYFDNPKGQGQDGIPYGTVESRGIPLDYKKSSQINLQASYSFLSWEKEGKSYELQRTNLATSATMMQSNIIMGGIAFTTRSNNQLQLCYRCRWWRIIHHYC